MRQAKKSIVAVLALGLLFCASCRKKTEPGETPHEHPSEHPAAESNAIAPAQVPQEQPAVVPPVEPAPGPGLTEQAVPMDLKQFSSLKDSDAKIDWIYEFADAQPDQIIAMALKALDDKDVDVRSAALEVLIDNEVAGASEVIKKAMKDREEDVRQMAIEACEYLDDIQAQPILIDALADGSESVREAALMTAEQKEDNDLKIAVYKTAMTSKYEDVKDSAIPALVDLSTPQAVDVLIEGLKDPDPEFRQEIIESLDLMVGQEFENYQQAQNWWNANRKRFDEELVEIEEAPE